MNENDKKKAPVIRDRISKVCALVADRFGLSAREAEVAELIVRGYTVEAASEQLFVSVNTLRTHAKRIYSKIGIHKRQELIDMVDEFEGDENV